MATSNNEVLKGLSGRVGNLLFRQRNSKTIVSPMPMPSGKRGTPAQRMMRKEFGMAAKLVSHTLKQDPELKAHYQQLAGPNGSAYRRALAAWLEGSFTKQPKHTPPVKEKYMSITVQVPDQLEVASIQLTVKKGDGSMELVTARPNAETGQWVYKPARKTKKAK